MKGLSGRGFSERQNLHFDVEDQLFEREFNRDFGALEDRCFYLTADAGEEIGTITAWWQPDLNGKEWGQIHWVAIHPDYQGRGLCQANDVCGDGMPQAIPPAQFSRHLKRADSRDQSVSRLRILPRP